MCIQRCSKDMVKFGNYAHSYTSTYINKSPQYFPGSTTASATTATAMATMSAMTTPSISTASINKGHWSSCWWWWPGGWWWWWPGGCCWWWPGGCCWWWPVKSHGFFKLVCCIIVRNCIGQLNTTGVLVLIWYIKRSH